MVFALLPRELTKAELAYVHMLYGQINQFVLGQGTWNTLYIEEINHSLLYVKGAVKNVNFTKVPIFPRHYTATHVLNPHTMMQYALKSRDLREWEYRSSFPGSTHTAQFMLPYSMSMMSSIIVLDEEELK